MRLPNILVLIMSEIAQGLPARMFVSAMQRPQQTALPLARALGCAVRVRDDLHEIAMTFTGFSGLPGVRTLAGLLDDNGKNLMATTAAQIKARAPHVLD